MSETGWMGTTRSHLGKLPSRSLKHVGEHLRRKSDFSVYYLRVKIATPYLTFFGGRPWIQYKKQKIGTDISVKLEVKKKFNGYVKADQGNPVKYAQSGEKIGKNTGTLGT